MLDSSLSYDIIDVTDRACTNELIVFTSLEMSSDSILLFSIKYFVLTLWFIWVQFCQLVWASMDRSKIFLLLYLVELLTIPVELGNVSRIIFEPIKFNPNALAVMLHNYAWVFFIDDGALKIKRLTYLVTGR